MKKQKRGISLIVLVMCIILVVTLAGGIVINVSNNNPMENANKEKFLSDIDIVKSELEMYVIKKQSDSIGGYDRKTLEANKERIIESGKEYLGRNITDIIKSIKGTKYEDKIQILEGKIVYVGKDKNEINWSNSANIEVTEININIETNIDDINISGKIKVTGNLADEKNVEKYEIYVAKDNEEYASSPSQIIAEKSLSVNYNIADLEKGIKYKLKVDLILNGTKYTKEIKDRITVNNELPLYEEIIATITPNTWTNENVKVILSNISEDTLVKQYTLPGSDKWINYTRAFSVSRVGDINIKIQDQKGNEIIKTVSVDNIDKNPPKSVVLTPNSASNLRSVTVNILAKDEASTDEYASSGIKAIKYQWLTTNTKLPVTDISWNRAYIVENGGNITRSDITATNYLHVLVEDNAGNKDVFVSGSYTLDNEAPSLENLKVTLSKKTWTNSDISVTIDNIPDDAKIVQYTLPGSSTWIDYTGKFNVSRIGTINIRLKDELGNEVIKAILVDNIDKLAPISVSLSPNSSSNVKGVTVSITAEDSASNSENASSGINSIKYQWLTSNVTLPVADSSWENALTIENGKSVTRDAITAINYLHILVEDKAGNKNVFVSGAYDICNTSTNLDCITASISPSIWTNSDVSVTIDNIPDDVKIVQYTLPGSSTWLNYKGKFSVSKTGIINVKVQDLLGNELTKTILIDKIDKIAPRAFMPAATSTTSTLKVVADTTDNEKTDESASSGISGYRFSIDNGLTWTAYQESGTYEYTGLVSETSYTVRVQAKDNAGNVTEASITKSTCPNVVSTTSSYVGYYADIDADGTVDGIIYADLLFGESGQWINSDGAYTIPFETNTRSYYISSLSYNGPFGTKEVVSPSGIGKDRFYVMALTDVYTKQYYWYKNATNKMKDYATATSVNFGSGRENTNKMIEYWNRNIYGSKNSLDMWGNIQEKVAEGWFVPSRGEWAVFNKKLGITKSNRYNFELMGEYWTSSQYNKKNAWRINYNGGHFGYNNVKTKNAFVRLSTTF